MKRSYIVLTAAAVLSVTVGAVFANDSDNRSRRNRLFAVLKPSEEVPVVSSPNARGVFKATIDAENEVISYELSYEGLEGVPGQAHIHIGQKSVNGDVTLFLCGNAPTVPPAAFPQPPACPPSPATITGELRPANIIPTARQGIAAMEFAEIVDLLLSGDTYANVHTAKFPAGEVRGQIIGLPGNRPDRY